ncbi:MAG: OmpA family protein [Deltaproteobacteria bacterium]|nr:OmpA family protein [Deltaproteobacteria bacterium]
MRRVISYAIIFLFLSSVFYLTGCETSRTAKGAGIGAAAGAAVGAIIGHQSDHRTEGAAVGAVVGGTVGAIIGKRLDNQAKELEQVQGVENVNVDQEQQKIEATLKINFDVDKDVIKPTEASKLDELAGVFANYPENIVVLEGHTDSDGAESYNQTLSEKRAKSVENYLRGKNLNIASLSSAGYGESRPIASNETQEGKAQNRRVEIKISVDPNRVPQNQGG